MSICRQYRRKARTVRRQVWGKFRSWTGVVIEWIYEPEQGSSDHLKVGISVMYPKAFQPRHIHYGDEQFMYIISGHGWQKIGEENTVSDNAADQEGGVRQTRLIPMC